MTRTAPAVLASLLLLAACASSGGGGATAPRRNANELSAAELTDPALASVTLFDAIQRLRPNWIRERGATSLAGADDRFPRVMVNESPSSFDVLRGLSTTDVTLVQYMSGADATTLYGTGYVNGLIKVRTAGR